MNYGRYQIIEELGRGSMGVVYKAHDPQIDRTIALKVLREDRVTSDDFVRRFLKEAMAVGRLSHPGIVTVYDVGQDHGSVFIAMEFLHGTPLDMLMAARKFTLEEIVDIGIQISQALHYAHQHGIIHRDIKPPNIIYSPQGLIQVTDFGIARIEDPDGQQMTQVGEVLGTPRYMSPEQAMGQPLDGRSDLYSLGVILYQLTTGRHPFQGDTMIAIFRAITQDTPEPPDTLDVKIPAPLSNLIMILLDKDPLKRFANGEDLIYQLRHCLSTGPEPKETISAPVTSTTKNGGPAKKIAITGLVGLIISVGAGGYYFIRQHSGPPAQPIERTTTSQKNEPIPQKLPDQRTNTSSPERDVPVKTPITGAVEVKPGQLILQATALSAAITDLQKKEIVLNSAFELGKISPRYQEDVKIAENTYKNAQANQQKKLALYLDEISRLRQNYTTEQITKAMEHIRKENVSERQNGLISLSILHLKSLENGAKLNPEKILLDFSRHLNNFAD